MIAFRSWRMVGRATGRRVVAIMDATLTRLIRSQPAKMAEWEQLKRVRVKPTAVRSPVGLVESSSTPIKMYSTHAERRSTPDVRAAEKFESYSTRVVR